MIEIGVGDLVEFAHELSENSWRGIWDHGPMIVTAVRSKMGGPGDDWIELRSPDASDARTAGAAPSHLRLLIKRYEAFYE